MGISYLDACITSNLCVVGRAKDCAGGGGRGVDFLDLENNPVNINIPNRHILSNLRHFTFQILNKMIIFYFQVPA